MTTQKLRIREATPPPDSESLSLPSEFAKDSADRLAMLAALYAFTYLIAAFVIPYPENHGTGGLISQRTMDILGYCFIGGALLLFVWIKSGRLNPKHLTPHGVAFQVYGAIGIDLGLLTWNGDPVGIPNGPTWVAVWILSFPLFLPSRPRTTLVAGALTASVQPMMVILVGVMGVTLPSFPELLPPIVASFISAGIATFASKVIHRLGQDVTAAKRMGSYRLTEQIGTGGMGAVWRAEHRLLARSAAIKLIHTEGMHEAQRTVLLERFEREVQSTARLQSPHTIDVYDYGVTTDGTFYYVMELLDGISLDLLITRYGPQHPARVIHILRQICHSLGEAHENGMFHRDIKPPNIFVCRRGRDTDVVKVLDFGLVKIEQPQLPQDMGLTMAGHFIGTPTYASPEMANGEANKVDHRTDIYQVGCVAYWLLTGRTVFDEENVVKMLVAHAEKIPDPPSLHADQEIPAALDEAVLKCLEKEKEDRYSDVDALAEALGAIEPDCCWTPEDSKKWWNACGIKARKSISDSAVRTGEREAATVIRPGGAALDNAPPAAAVHYSLIRGGPRRRKRK